ncbi:MAG: tRNA (N6-threonylcarbamoyladenosine(37)-N6)-methyltransferase TrmO [Proteobacteria bacterium]|nr:tRNA (N6-threonylcarbamoyladenosine(37)-N6)-methyltransferase TrmO [Pseudomonadota bacterium]MCP4917670.1 tRNA (N6-threonylcarbamoyladenosine(37)-N6)-methyltransferase TrmO [Pseudomonadota bacterium]
MEPPELDDDRRAYTDAVAFPEQVSLRPVAVVRSPFRQRHGTPRQPGMTGPKERGVAQGRVELLDHVAPEVLQDLEGFDRIWLLCWLHLNGPGGRPMVKPPRGGPKRGLFATRAPHRPNPLALSCVELVGVERGALLVAGLDLLDGTPVLDIKPYVPEFDAFPQARAGWLDE